MKINFKRVWVKNFMNFGAKKTTLNFERGMNFFSGENGSGKSTFAGEALSFVLYGKPYRKIKKNELINRKNKKKMLCGCEFSINKDEYKIIRGMKPKILRIFHNGQELESLSSTKLTQNEIDDILGVDYKTFKQIISISSNGKNSFISLSKNDKREIVGNMFNLHRLTEAGKEFSEEKRNISRKIEQSKLIKNNLESKKDDLEEHYNKMKNILKTFNKNKEKEIDEITNEIKNKKEEIEEIKKQLKKHSNFKTKYKNNIESIKKNNDKLNELEVERNTIRMRLKDRKSKLDFFQKNDVCPYCENDLTGNHKNDHLQELKSEMKKDLSLLKEFDKKTQTKNKKDNQLKEKRKDLEKTKEDILILKNNIDSIKENIKRLENDKKKKDIDGIGVNESDIETIKDEIKSNEKSYDKIDKELTEQIDYFNILNISEEVLSDDGVKSVYFDMIVPILNNKINEYTQKFEMPILVTFNNLMEVNINDINHKHKINYFSFSEGEKKKIDISIMLSFVYMSKMISNWDCNVLFMDEVLDGKIDAKTLDIIIEILNKLVTEDKELSLYVVSHRNLPKTLFNRIYHFEEINGYSELSTEKEI